MRRGEHFQGEQRRHERPPHVVVEVWAPLDAIVTPTPKIAWLTRWPSSKAGAVSPVAGGVATGNRGLGTGGVRRTDSGFGRDADVHDPRLGAGVCASR
jgi:hypothetical protein